MERCTLKIGICMAGAVSAGAYSAGVLDYLFEVLEAFYKAKELDPSLENVDIKVEVMGGASAGGMLAAICALFVHQERPSNLFKKLWVDMTADDMLTELLSTDDLKSNAKAKSILNSSFIDRLAKPIESSFEDIVKSKRDIACKPYMAEDFDVFMTLFNLSGLKFSFAIEGNADIHGKENTQFLTQHRDLAVFTRGSVYKKNGKMPLLDNSYPYFRTFVQVAKATGAFPFGLSTRIVTRRAEVIKDTYEELDQRNKNAGFTLSLGEDSDMEVSTMNADGGTANNEPIDLLKVLMSKKVAKDEYQINLFVDPFPSYYETDSGLSDSDVSLNKLLVPFVFSLRNQLLFDIATGRELEQNAVGNTITKMIAPKETGKLDKHALPSSAFGGFGGFIHKDFRVHDYQLGRKNCQKFLRTQLIFPTDESKNSSNTNGFLNRLAGYLLNSDQVKMHLKESKTPDGFLPLIPDFTKHNKQQVDPIEKLKSDYFENYKPLLNKRLIKLGGKFFDPLSLLNVVGIAGSFFFSNSVSDGLFEHFETELRNRDLMEG